MQVLLVNSLAKEEVCGGKMVTPSSHSSSGIWCSVDRYIAACTRDSLAALLCAVSPKQKAHSSPIS